MIKDKNVAKETKTAVAEEKDRRKRIEERQAQYNKMFSLTEESDKTISKLVLDFDPESKEVLVEVDKKLVTKLKPHQARGVKFMWDACFESIAQIEEGKVNMSIIARHFIAILPVVRIRKIYHRIWIRIRPSEKNRIRIRPSERKPDPDPTSY